MRTTMRRVIVSAAALLAAATMSASVGARAATGTLYVHIVCDQNAGKIHVAVRKHSSATPMAQADLTAGQIFDKTFPNIQTGPQEWYLVDFSWPATDFHNLSDGAGDIIATGKPADANNRVTAWQAAGKGVNVSIPALMR